MHESKTYKYDVLLGKGATASVYKGVSKFGAQCHALKVFNSNSTTMRRSINNEVSILQKLNHENIVKFFGVESELFSDRAVIVLELLEHGTLLQQLRKPKNTFGFSEKKLFGLLKDLNSGLKILREYRIVHRDIKPTNILRTINCNGREIYKLSDFGNAKIIDDESEFFSVVGTEEYLHPMIFEKAFITNNSSGVKNADAWSLGVTIYQVITGRIPFETKDGYRRNRSLRYEMISTKPPNAISAFEGESNSFCWEKELPETCKLSSVMKRKFERIIRHLLTISDDSLSIKDYLDTIDGILEKKPIFIFRPSTGKLVTCYLDHTRRIPHLKDKIAKELNIRSEHQMIFFNFIEMTSDSTSISYLSSNTKKRPLILIEKGTNNIEKPRPSYINNIIPSGKTTLSYASDVCSLLHRIKKEFKYNVRTYDHIYNAVCILDSLTISELKTCDELIRNLCPEDEFIKEKAQHIQISTHFQFDNNPNQEYKQTKAQYKDIKDLIVKLKSMSFDEDAQNMRRDTMEAMYTNALSRFQEHDSQTIQIINNFGEWKRKTLSNLENIRTFKGDILTHIKEKMSMQ